MRKGEDSLTLLKSSEVGVVPNGSLAKRDDDAAAYPYA